MQGHPIDPEAIFSDKNHHIKHTQTKRIIIPFLKRYKMRFERVFCSKSRGPGFLYSIPYVGTFVGLNIEDHTDENEEDFLFQPFPEFEVIRAVVIIG